MKKTVVIIQARMGSTRLPGKILKPICGKEMLWHIVTRARGARGVAQTILATTTQSCDDAVAEFCLQKDIPFFRGSEENVLERYYKCAVENDADVIIRLTCDNPLIDPRIIDRTIEAFTSSDSLDYLKYRKGLPLGFQVEIFSMSALKKAYTLASLPQHFEHVTNIMYTDSNNFKYALAPQEGEDFSCLRWTVDTLEDYTLASKIYEALYSQNPLFGFDDIIAAYSNHPEWLEINKEIKQKQV